MRAILIINPVSGGDSSNGEKVAEIQTFLARASFVPEVVQTSADKTAGQITRDALAAGIDAVLAAGGDGTVSEVARELVNTRVTLGILPVGTFNNIARSLGITADVAAACNVIAQGEVRRVDIGIANETTAFFEAAGTGLDATLFPIGEEIKAGRWSRIFSAIRLTMQSRVQPITISFDRTVREALPAGTRRAVPRRALDLRTIRRNALLVVAANGPFYGGGFTIAPRARMSDGRLTLSVFTHFSKLELARHFFSISRGQYRYSPKIETFHAATITLDSPVSLPVHVDGQPFGKLPVTLKALPQALRVFAPGEPLAARDPDPPVALPVPEQKALTNEREKEVRALD